ncbi:MAG: ATP-binding protein [Thermoproteota archaeon]|nr:MAG: ATP-binding protein [Candidatus Korarchaeota archaeon]
MISFEVLLRRNPWWRGREFFEEDEDYRKWMSKSVRWVPGLLHEIKLKPFSLHFLFGPRQVGKTTLMKLLVKKVLDEGAPPRSVFYFRCDELKDYRELRELIEAYLNLREAWGIKSSYILLDEITFPEEWYRAIKAMIDDGLLARDILVLSGSASLEVRRDIERFPGRRGGGRDYRLLPLCFRDFIKVLEPPLYSKLPKLESLREAEVAKKAAEASVHLTELNKLLRAYFEVGGFPLAINAYRELGYVPQEVPETYLAWVRGDLAKIGRSPEVAREILRSILVKLPTPVSWESISKDTSIRSPKTASTYVHTLSHMFILNIHYYIDISRGTVSFLKNKKISLIDPLLIKAFEDWCLVELKNRESILAENTLAAHIARAGRAYYWKDKTEVDCILQLKDSLIGFEVKWRGKPKPHRIRSSKLKVTYTLTKSMLDVKEKMLPLSVFLALLDPTSLQVGYSS